jgi:hypothetical protein
MDAVHDCPQSKKYRPDPVEKNGFLVGHRYIYIYI